MSGGLKYCNKLYFTAIFQHAFRAGRHDLKIRIFTDIFMINISHDIYYAMKIMFKDKRTTHADSLSAPPTPTTANSKTVI